MAAYLGQVGDFADGSEDWTQYAEGSEDWTQYAECLGHFMAPNGIEEAERKGDVLLFVIGPKEYRLLGSSLAPAKPGEKLYDELVEVLSAHHNPAPLEIVQRYQFHTRMRELGETVSKYVSELLFSENMPFWDEFGRRDS